MICNASVKQKILVVDDEPEAVELVAFNLKQAGYEPIAAADGAEALAKARAKSPNLIVLDLMLPEMSGLEVCKTLRRDPATAGIPIIMLTAKAAEIDRVLGLELGADDYITKPFSLAILRARVNARLRRQSAPAQAVRIDGFVFDFDRMAFTAHGAPVELSKTEQKLLRLLVENRGQTLQRAALLDRVWSDGAAYVDENALSVTIKRLRDKLEPEPARPRYIKTVYGVGYVWAVK